MKATRPIALFLLITLLLCGCSAPAAPAATHAPTAAKTPDSAPSSSAAPDSAVADAFTYPMEPVTLTINYDEIDYTALADWQKEHYFWDELQARTGVTLKRIGAASNAMAVSDQFVLMLASGDYSDIMCANWLNFPGGPNAALNEEYIIALNDHMDSLPNFAAQLEADPEFAKTIMTDEGVYYCFPYYMEPRGAQYTGLVLRQDWLSSLNLAIPETAQELQDVLTAFKNELGVVSPLTFECRWLFLENAAASLSSAFNVTYPFYVEDQQVKFGPAQPGYLEFLTTMNAWYAQGLIDQDMPSINKATVQAKFASGEAGASIQQISNIGSTLLANAEDPDFQISAAPSLAASKGERPQFSHRNNRYSGSFSWAVSTTCANTEAALRLCDYVWSEEGQLFCAYGTEGYSYQMIDGKPVLTDLVTHNEFGSTREGARKSFGITSNFPYYGLDHDASYDDALYDIKTVWADNDSLRHMLPPVTFTQLESSLVSSKYGNIDTYAREMITKFIIGSEPLSNYDAFLDTLDSYGLQDVLSVYSAAYERFKNR